MRYSSMMEDYPIYINNHPEEKLTAKHLGQIHSCKGEYLSYLFSCYYKETLDEYIKRVREGKEHHKEDVIMPEKRLLAGKRVTVRTKLIEGFFVEALPVIKNEYALYRPIEATVEEYKSSYDKKEESVALWWHDAYYISHYMQGRILNASKKVSDEAELIHIPPGRYAVFSMKKSDNPVEWIENLKDIIHYAQKQWVAKNEKKVDAQGYNFQLINEKGIYYYVALLEEEKEEDLNTVYGVETWTKYIDDNIMGNLTVSSLATKFHYSPTHFKRVFKFYYKMSVADYIRKRKLAKIAEEIRAGKEYQKTAVEYGFKTYAGFSRAFEKEFHMSPAAYKKGTFEIVDLSKYYKEYKDSLRLSIAKIREIKMIGHTIISSKGEDVDIPAQINYWLDKDFPCMKDTRFEYNIAKREDKIALWHHNAENGDIEYILGPVVEDFAKDIPNEMIKLTLEGGRYAIFETEKISDEEDVAELLRRYARCVFFGWIKENRDMVDLLRITFERYVNGKIYLYVPLK